MRRFCRCDRGAALKGCATGDQGAALKGCATGPDRRGSTGVAQPFRAPSTAAAGALVLPASTAAAPPLLMLASAGAFAAPLDLRLIDAVKNRDAAAVRTLLAARPAIDVNAAAGDGATALHWA